MRSDPSVLPPVCLVLATLNAMPHLRKAMDALARQEYPNLKLIVQDGHSKDDTLEYLKSLTLFSEVDIDSRPDSGVAQAFARGLARATGKYVMIISADEALAPNAISRLVAVHENQAGLGVVYGAVEILDPDGGVPRVHRPPAFDLFSVMACEMVIPIAACMFNKEVIGEDFYFDESLITCPDYEFWIRLGGRFDASKFVYCDDILASALGDRTSMSYRPEVYYQFVRDKISALRDYLEYTVRSETLRTILFNKFGRGIYCWAAEMVYSLEGASPTFASLCRSALTTGAMDQRLRYLIGRSPELRAWSRDPSGPLPVVMPSSPREGRSCHLADLDLSSAFIGDDWGVEVASGDNGVTIRGGPASWGYCWLLPLPAIEPLSEPRPLWIKVDYVLTSGRAGVGLLESDEIQNERMVSASAASTATYVKLVCPTANAHLLIRNAGHPALHITISNVSIVTEERSTEESHPLHL